MHKQSQCCSACTWSCLLNEQGTEELCHVGVLSEEKRTENTTPIGVNLMRSQVLYLASQDLSRKSMPFSLRHSQCTMRHAAPDDIQCKMCALNIHAGMTGQTWLLRDVQWALQAWQSIPRLCGSAYAKTQARRQAGTHARRQARTHSMQVTMQVQ